MRCTAVYWTAVNCDPAVSSTLAVYRSLDSDFALSTAAPHPDLIPISPECYWGIPTDRSAPPCSAWGNGSQGHSAAWRTSVEGATLAVHHRTAGASLEGMGLRMAVTVQHRGSARVRGVLASMPQHGAADVGVKDSPPRGK